MLKLQTTGIIANSFNALIAGHFVFIKQMIRRNCIWLRYTSTNLLSKDQYHEQIPSINVSRLRGPSFFDETSKATDFSTVPVVNSGRARKLAITNKRYHIFKSNCVERFATECFEVVGEEQMFVSDTLVLTVDGEILCDCDYEYDATHKVKICDVGEFERYCSNFIDASESSAANRCAS